MAIRAFMSVPVPQDIFLPNKFGISPGEMGGVGPEYITRDWPSGDDLIPRVRKNLQVKGIDDGGRPFAGHSLSFRSDK